VNDEHTVKDVTRRANDYLAVADRLVPGWITDFYVVGSASLGEYVPGRSDVDFVAVVADRATRMQLVKLRAVHVAAGLIAAERTRTTGGTPNGVFVTSQAISLPVTDIQPVASHTGLTFEVGRGFDVNPVIWRQLSTGAIRVRGREPAELDLNPRPDVLQAWNLANLEEYWLPLGRKMAAGRTRRTVSGFRYGYPWAVAWATLGPSRLHCTVTTGDVIGKRPGGEYALDTFDSEWHPVIRLGLNWWHRNNAPPARADDARRAGQFALHVVEDAQRHCSS
jgi:hypothetical protein